MVMPSYYTTHPNLGISAMVDAPATEKARTTFLDFLERSGQINRADRQYWRKNMVAERMEDPYEVQADVELQYGYEKVSGFRGSPEGFREVPESELLVYPPAPEGSIADDYPGYSEPEGEGFTSGEFREAEEPQQLNLSPIARKSLGRYVG